jgi:hypothetical protein
MKGHRVCEMESATELQWNRLSDCVGPSYGPIRALHFDALLWTCTDLQCSRHQVCNLDLQPGILLTAVADLVGVSLGP